MQSIYTLLLLLLLFLNRSYNIEELPIHPCLELLFVSDQKLSGGLGRLLITMKKVKNPVDTVKEREICLEHMKKYEENYINLKEKIYAPKNK